MAKGEAKKTGRVHIAVPENKEAYYSQLFYTIVYKDDKDDGTIYEVIKDNPHLTASEINWILERDHRIKRHPGRIKKMAERVGLPIKE